MSIGPRIRKALIALPCLFVILVVLHRIHGEWGVGRLSGEILERKFWNCYVSKWGFLAVASVGISSFLIGHRALRGAWSRLDAWALGKLLLALVVLNALAGVVLFQTSIFTHAMFRWSAEDYMRVMGINLLLSSVPTCVVLLVARPAKLVHDVGLVPVLCLASGVLVTSYMFASIVYMASYGPVLVE